VIGRDAEIIWPESSIRDALGLEPRQCAGYCFVAFCHGFAAGPKVLAGSIERADGEVAISDFVMYDAMIAQHNGKHSCLAEGIAGLGGILPEQAVELLIRCLVFPHQAGESLKLLIGSVIPE
jgi:hypothetical protein